MNRSGQNFIIDVVMFVLMMGLAGIGFLLEYVLVPGREVAGKYGVNAELYLFGLEREQWADIHLVMAYVLLALLVLHIALHWRPVCAMYRNLVPRPAWRKAVIPVFVAVNLVLCFFFLFIQPDFREFTRGSGRGRLAELATAKQIPAGSDMQENIVEAAIQRPETEAALNAAQEIHATVAGQRPDIKGENKRLEMVKGMYTLGEVAATYNVPAKYLKDKLGLPTSISSLEKLGRLRRRYGFAMSDVERIIAEYKVGK